MGGRIHSAETQADLCAWFLRGAASKTRCRRMRLWSLQDGSVFDTNWCAGLRVSGLALRWGGDKAGCLATVSYSCMSVATAGLSLAGSGLKPLAAGLLRTLRSRMRPIQQRPALAVSRNRSAREPASVKKKVAVTSVDTVKLWPVFPEAVVQRALFLLDFRHFAFLRLYTPRQ